MDNRPVFMPQGRLPSSVLQRKLWEWRRASWPGSASNCRYRHYASKDQGIKRVGTIQRRQGRRSEDEAAPKNASRVAESIQRMLLG